MSLVLVKSLETVAKKAEGESAGWTVKLIIFVGGTCGFVHVQTFNSNLKELGVVESKRNALRRRFVHELLNAGHGLVFIICTQSGYEKRRLLSKEQGGRNLQRTGEIWMRTGGKQ